MRRQALQERNGAGVREPGVSSPVQTHEALHPRFGGAVSPRVSWAPDPSGILDAVIHLQAFGVKGAASTIWLTPEHWGRRPPERTARRPPVRMSALGRGIRGLTERPRSVVQRSSPPSRDWSAQPTPPPRNRPLSVRPTPGSVSRQTVEDEFESSGDFGSRLARPPRLSDLPVFREASAEAARNRPQTGTLTQSPGRDPLDCGRGPIRARLDTRPRRGQTSGPATDSRRALSPSLGRCPAKATDGGTAGADGPGEKDIVLDALIAGSALSTKSLPRTDEPCGFQGRRPRDRVDHVAPRPRRPDRHPRGSGRVGRASRPRPFREPFARCGGPTRP